MTNTIRHENQMAKKKNILPSALAVVICAALGLAAPAHAQALDTHVNSGQLLQQMPQQPLTIPRQDLDLHMLQPPTGGAPQSKPFLVRTIEVTGSTLLPEKTLRALIATDEGKEVTLADLYGLAEKISAAYREAGYPLTRAYVPAQTIENGKVRIAVVEARYDHVKLNNQSTVTDRTLEKTLAPVHNGEPVYNPTLERSLLLLSDIPGVGVNSVIRPGSVAGTSDLDVYVRETPRYSGTLALDDYGTNATGKGRLSGTLDVNSPFHVGDRLRLGALTSGAGLNYLSGQYRSLLNGQGTTLDVGGSWMHYRLGHGFGHPDSLQQLDASGGAAIGSLALTHPLVRSTRSNLYGQLKYEYRWLKDDVGVAQIRDRRDLSVGSATLAGDERDAHGVTNYSLSGSFGHVSFRDQLAGLVDQLTVGTAGGYAVGRASIARLQRLAPQHAIYAGYTVQFASRNLDPSEQFYLGGPTTVRGLRQGVLSGSNGDVLTLEYRYDFQVNNVPGHWQIAPFFDTGRIRAYKDNPIPGATNTARVNSVGVGMNWYGPNDWVLSAAVARQVGGRPVLLASQEAGGTRVWVQLRKGFN